MKSTKDQKRTEKADRSKVSAPATQKAPETAPEQERASLEFWRRKREQFLERDIRLRLERRMPAEQKALVEWGGFYIPSYTFYDDIDGAIIRMRHPASDPQTEGILGPGSGGEPPSRDRFQRRRSLDRDPDGLIPCEFEVAVDGPVHANGHRGAAPLRRELRGDRVAGDQQERDKRSAEACTDESAAPLMSRT